MRGRQLESEHGRAPQLPRGRLSVAHDVQGWLTHRSGPRCQLRSRPHAVPPGKFLLSLVSLESTQRPAHWRVKALSVVGLNGKSLSVGPRQGGGGVVSPGTSSEELLCLESRSEERTILRMRLAGAGARERPGPGSQSPSHVFTFPTLPRKVNPGFRWTGRQERNSRPHRQLLLRSGSLSQLGPDSAPSCSDWEVGMKNSLLKARRWVRDDTFQ